MPRSVAPKKKSAPKTLTPAQFWRLPVAQRRIAVAKDVIQQVISGKYDAEPGSGSFFAVDDGGATLSRNQVKNLESCCVCGLGACLASAVALGNRFTIHNDEDLSRLWPFLKKIFTEKTLALIEIAFERGDGAFRLLDRTPGPDLVVGNGEVHVADITSDEYREASYFARSSEHILVAIMQNIIENNGEFVPSNG